MDRATACTCNATSIHTQQYDPSSSGREFRTARSGFTDATRDSDRCATPGRAFKEPGQSVSAPRSRSASFASPALHRCPLFARRLLSVPAHVMLRATVGARAHPFGRRPRNARRRRWGTRGRVLPFKVTVESLSAGGRGRCVAAVVTVGGPAVRSRRCPAAGGRGVRRNGSGRIEEKVGRPSPGL